MFANLKNKLIEEVKASPSKFQQFANAAQAAVSSTSTTPSGSESTTTTNAANENFFSITEEDTPQNSPYKQLKLPTGSIRGRNSTHPQNNNNGTGAIPRTRKLSNSSMASDISFRMPAWEGGSVYHLQSDLDESGSEMGDTASTAAKLDVITKEQLFDAYRKSLDRYHKYRCRYTDLAKKYKDLERDSTKARSVLVETQEKAIRRINELREQCSLEQQAKAHLEEALRIEMDDMQCKMQAYQTKLKLLGENPDNVGTVLAGGNSKQLIDLATDGIETTEKSLINISENCNNDEHTKSRFEHYEKLLQERNHQINELNNKLELFRKQEEENVLLLAQTKAAIHSELENKESEVKKLGETVKQLQSELQLANKKEKQIGIAAEELNEMKEKLKQTQLAKQELDAKIIATEHMFQEMREKHNAKENNHKAIEEQLETQTKESEAKLQELKQQNQQLNEMVTRYQQNEVSLAEVDNELNRTKNENDILKTRLSENELKLQETENRYNEQLRVIEQLQCDLKEKEELLNQTVEKFEECQEILQQENLKIEEYKEKCLQLENELKIFKDQTTNSESEIITTLKSELERVTVELNQQLKMAKEQLSNKEKELKSLTKKSMKNEKQQESYMAQIQEQNEEIEKLKNVLIKQENLVESLRIASQQREQQTEKEKDELKTQVNSILSEITQMEEQMRIVKDSHSELENEKLNLEKKIENMQRQSQTTQENSKHWQEVVNEAEEKLKLCEQKLQTVESEHTQIAEKNCLLEENTHRLEKLLAEKEKQQTETDDALVSELRLKLETTENSLQKLNEKMQEVLDENSRLHNNQELNDHDHRTLQDRYDSLEKEKACLEDNKQCLEQELNTMKGKLSEEQQRNELIQNEVQKQQDKLNKLLSDMDSKEEELKNERQLSEKVKKELQQLQEQLELSNTTQNNLLEVNETLKEKQKILQEIENKMKDEKLKQQQQLEEKENRIGELTKNYQRLSGKHNELLLAKQQLDNEKEERNQELEKIKEELVLLREQKECLNKDLFENNSKLNSFKQKEQETDANIKELQLELESSKELLCRKEKELVELQEVKQNLFIEQQEKGKLSDLLTKSQLQLKELQLQYTQNVKDIEILQNKLSKQTSEDTEIEQLKIENEYLNKHTKQLESEIAKHQEQEKYKHSNSQELNDKLNSLQCELYVLRENAEKFNIDIEEKEKHNQELKAQNNLLTRELDQEKSELQRQLEHIKYITEQDDIVKKDLLITQNKLKDLETKYANVTQELDKLREKSTLKNEEHLKLIDSLNNDLERNSLTIEILQKEVKDLNNELENKEILQKELQDLKETLEEPSAVLVTQTNNLESSNSSKASSGCQDSEHLRKINETLQRELEELKRKSTSEISTLQQDMEDLQTTNKQMADRIMDLERLRAGLQAQKLFGFTDNIGINTNKSSNSVAYSSLGNATTDMEKEELETKLKTIMEEVQDVSNRNLFLEQKCENYLILEQSNERLKLQNAKLSRQLDETLVSMQHNEGIAANTEFEYLKNIMFQYLTGSANGNNETLVKVISAVLKFSPQQTQVALEKEHQRRSLINKIL